MTQLIFITDSVLHDKTSGKDESSVCVSVTVCLKHDNTTRICVNPSGTERLFNFLTYNIFCCNDKYHKIQTK